MKTSMALLALSSVAGLGPLAWVYAVSTIDPANTQAYGANVGWIAVEQTHGQPRIDLRTGNLNGFAWGANVGWISLSNAQAYVRTVTLDSGPDREPRKGVGKGVGPSIK
ncbi:MAG: hypothetical protein MUC65_09370 [Pontiellaceae bacterium]|jgi:hypothetical protein|nr:hypothetical protein [Pontiellaceae bacterium]